jgi:AcrR family transcriptional regulator
MDAKPGLRDRKKTQTRRLILKCSEALFRKRGFAATTLEDIARKAGVHKQTVLRYFGSKEEIALAFRQVALHNFKKGLLDPDRQVGVLEYWRDFIEASALRRPPRRWLAGVTCCATPNWLNRTRA